jgi:UDP-N-acetylglucosamine 2-epimerase (non-hydrolysing)
MQEEVSVLRIPTLVIRNETEYMHYVEAGVLRLTGTDAEVILEAAEPLIRSEAECERVKGLRIDVPKSASADIVRTIKAFLG